MAAAELSPCVRCRRARAERAGGLPGSASKAGPGAAACRHNRGCPTDRTGKAPPPRRRPREPRHAAIRPLAVRGAGEAIAGQEAGGEGATSPAQRAAAPPQSDRIMALGGRAEGDWRQRQVRARARAPPGRTPGGRCRGAFVRRASKRPQKALKYYHYAVKRPQKR